MPLGPVDLFASSAQDLELHADQSSEDSAEQRLYTA
jgi:hypothetical protein